MSGVLHAPSARVLRSSMHRIFLRWQLGSLRGRSVLVRKLRCEPEYVIPCVVYTAAPVWVFCFAIFSQLFLQFLIMFKADSLVRSILKIFSNLSWMLVAAMALVWNAVIQFRHVVYPVWVFILNNGECQFSFLGIQCFASFSSNGNGNWLKVESFSSHQAVSWRTCLNWC